VHTARYAGPEAGYAANRRALLAAMEGVADRRARFRTVVALVLPGGGELLAEGIIEGAITTAERGVGGFGYDPIFEVAGRTLAEMGEAEKNRISHRGRALAAWPPPPVRAPRGETACPLLGNRQSEVTSVAPMHRRPLILLTAAVVALAISPLPGSAAAASALTLTGPPGPVDEGSLVEVSAEFDTSSGLPQLLLFSWATAPPPG